MKHPLLLASLCAPLAGPALAAESIALDPVVVTATRTPETADDTLAAVTVLDRAEIERRQPNSVTDLLRGVPGVSIAQTGGRGAASSVFLRGTNSDHVLVLIDGVKVGSATLGSTSFQDLPVEQIERIEIVRGPRSSLYGSEAIGGVIQIFTKRGGGPFKPTVSLGGGTLNTKTGAVSLSGGGDDAWLHLGANYESTDGINGCDGRVRPPAGCRADQPDRDGFRNLGLSLRAGYAFADLAEIDVHLLRSENEAEFDGNYSSGNASAGNASRSEQQVLGAKATLTPAQALSIALAAGRSWSKDRTYYADTSVYPDDIFLDRFNTERDTASLQGNYRILEDHLITLGVDYLEDRVEATVDYAQDSRDNLGFFGEYQGQLGPSDLKLSLRQDDNQQFGQQSTGNAALGYLFRSGIQASLGYGTAFKAPSFNELYYPNFGNPEIDPETSRSLELGLKGPLALGGAVTADWSLNLYQTKIDALISYDVVTFTAINIDEARIRGLEASTAATYRDWRLSADLTWLDPENRARGTNSGNLLPRRPEQTFALDVSRELGRWTLGGALFVAGRRFDDLANRRRLDAYSLVDLRLEYAFSPTLRLQARLENALDEDYETAYLYNQPGRAAYLTLRYTP